MSKQFAIVAFALLTVLFESSISQAQKTESFNSASASAANGWVAAGSGVDQQIAGFSNTSDAGGAVGEAQFDVYRGATLSYLDTNLGMTVNGNTAGGFSITGKLNYFGSTGATPDLGFLPVLGFSSSPSDYIGITFRGDFDDLGSDLAWGVRFENTGDGIRINTGGDFSRIITPNVQRTFSFVYDPSEGDFGSITASISGAGSSITHFLSETNRSLLNDASFSGAGFIKRGNTPDPEHGLFFRLDDLTYTGVAVPPGGLMGDFNEDGAVSAADYVIWRKAAGAGVEDLPNDNDDVGPVGSAEYDLWHTNFGGTSGGSGGAVPEPASWLSFTLIGCITLCGRRKR